MKNNGPSISASVGSWFSQQFLPFQLPKSDCLYAASTTAVWAVLWRKTWWFPTIPGRLLLDAQICEMKSQRGILLKASEVQGGKKGKYQLLLFQAVCSPGVPGGFWIPALGAALLHLVCPLEWDEQLQLNN